jgi:glycine/D-amino acid oxidase-like deaminating enzyme
VDAVVAGGGLVAAAIALELARRDLTVELLAGVRAGLPSAPGGAVAAQAVVESVPEALADLALLSRHLFSDWLSALEEETGLPCEYDVRGAVTVALDEAEEVALDRSLDPQRARGLHFEVLEPEEARGREPALSPALHAAFAFSRDGVARSGRVGRALVLAARAAGVRVREGSVAQSVAVSAGRVSGVELPGGFLPAETVVLAGRGGAGRVDGAPRLRLADSSRPWLRLDASRDPDRPARLLVSRGIRLVPRRDGTALVLGQPGPSEFPARVSVDRVSALLSELRRLVPASPTWGLVEAGSALEHAAPDRVPVLGETATTGLLLACAWGPDELLLAPAAAAVAADLVTGKAPPLAAAPFAPGRVGA